MQPAIAILSDRPTVSQLVLAHRNTTEMARGPLPSGVANALDDTACEIQKAIVATPAADWREFAAKACLLVDELTTDPTTGWLDAIRESLRSDVEHLAAAGG
ncbi:hypothetical protein NLM16_01245 [Bradyrhizobium brasilense]|uniref:hypothetical protein n=1 Tax=Bradyrhizobium brasilense TaxID=1419277 RepID=UPI002877C448|nr:hypothetical protein [Bradyrhizobium brasilense]MCP3412720.1 hypothetical protein [Bradyrhizobium brasilense]